jgi:hypothetical protein
MKTQKDKQFLLSRRNFILTAFMCTLLINKFISNHKNVEVSPQSSNKDEGFVILAGWVLLNEDLVENLG